MSDYKSKMELVMKLVTPEHVCGWCEYNGEPNGCNHPDFIGGCPAWDLAQDAAECLMEEDNRQLQKPLTLEEAKKEVALWFEYPPNIFNPRTSLLPELYSSDHRCESKYGYSWRCWATKPTDEERKAAEWKVE